MAKDILVPKTITGHSLIRNRPVFNRDSSKIIVSSGTDLLLFSTQTGVLLSTLKDPNQEELGYEPSDITSIHIDLYDSNRLVVCHENGWLLVWDIESKQVIRRKKLCLPEGTHNLFACRSTPHYYYCLVQVKEKKFGNFIVFPKTDLTGNNATIIDECKADLKETGFAFGPSVQPEPRFLATIHGCSVFIKDLKNEEAPVAKHPVHVREDYTCVAAHPSEDIVAAGKSNGMIVLFSKIFDAKDAIRTILHWHHEATADLVFSLAGSHLHSVGQECTIVTWTISDSEMGQKTFYPRVGPPMKYIARDQNGEHYAVCHIDNSITLLPRQVQPIKGILKNLINGCSATYGGMPQTGLVCANPWNAIALNGRTGHIQFYDPHERTLLYQLDVTHQNFIVPDRDVGDIVNADVTRIAFSPNGRWLASFESRDDGVHFPEMEMKIWHILRQKSTAYDSFTLNQRIQLPHKSTKTNTLIFSPNSEMLVSTNEDGCFKVWHSIEDEASPSGFKWISNRTGYLHSEVYPYAASFSKDSSLLAVSFSSVLTFWDVSDESKILFKKAMQPNEEANSSSSSPIKWLQFGRDEFSHLIVEVNLKKVTVTNLMTLDEQWSHLFSDDIDSFAFDQDANRMALFCSNLTAHIFHIDAESPLCSIDLAYKDLCRERIISAVYLEDIDSSDEHPSNLFFLSRDHRLLKFVPLSLLYANDEIEEKEEKVETPFRRLLMRSKGNNDEELLKFSESMLNSVKIMDDIFSKTPAHVMPPLTVIADNFIDSLLPLKAESGAPTLTSLKAQEKKLNDLMDVDEPDDEISETESELPQSNVKSAQEAVVEPISSEQHLEGSDEILTEFKEDYSWLRSHLK